MPPRDEQFYCVYCEFDLCHCVFSSGGAYTFGLLVLSQSHAHTGLSCPLAITNTVTFVRFSDACSCVDVLQLAILSMIFYFIIHIHISGVYLSIISL